MNQGDGKAMQRQMWCLMIVQKSLSLLSPQLAFIDKSLVEWLPLELLLLSVSVMEAGLILGPLLELPEYLCTETRICIPSPVHRMAHAAGATITVILELEGSSL